MITGKSFIGFSHSSDTSVEFKTFNPVLNQDNIFVFYECSESEVEEACKKAAKAYLVFREFSKEQRTFFLKSIYDELLSAKSNILKCYMLESGLPIERANSEFQRTLFQIKSFVTLIDTDSWKNKETTNKQKRLSTTKLPLGVVAVFGASNFPLAYSTIGGDSISALAAGCPVIVKSHPMHAGTGELVAEAVIKAAKKSKMPDGVFSNLNSKDEKVGVKLVQDSRLSAVGFTGSVNGGRAIYNIASKRKVPIPVFAEMGSLNPVFFMNDGLNGKNAQWASRFAKSITNDSGQFCTKPGLLIGVCGDYFDDFILKLCKAMETVEPSYMLHPNIKRNFVRKREALEMRADTQVLFKATENKGMIAEPTLIKTKGSDFLLSEDFKEEVFGPFSLAVECVDEIEMIEVIKHINGQLTGTIIGGVNTKKILEHDVCKHLSHKVGRLIINDVPTGVEVVSTMNHGGPYPASSDSRYTAVGVRSIERWVRTICIQG